MDQSEEYMSQPPKKKSSTLKWVLIGCGGLVVLAVIAITMDPAKVEAAAQAILPFDNSQGFTGSFSMDIAGTKMVTLMDKSGPQPGAMLFLASLPSGGNEDATQKQMLQSMEKRGGGKMNVAERRPDETFHAQGTDVTAKVNILQRGGDNAPRQIQYVLALRGTSGKPVITMFMGREETTTHEWVQQFLDTVKSSPE
jgi:hypothetical protein